MATRITFTGPESTGKTTLVNTLAKHMKADVVPEYAREYLPPGTAYTVHDIETIAQRQHDLITQCTAPLQLNDTDGLTTYLWALDKFGIDHSRLKALWRAHFPTHYLLCYPDLPWKEDPLREDAARLDEIFELYLSHILASEVPYTVIKGQGALRTQAAMEVIQRVIK